ncbi:MAG: hypothetical protein Q7U68_00715 [Candidatus Roizmanbacteria bacterium]|nr:hypothetical protein [Candidatus Roizmanbacteria bacterium]
MERIEDNIETLSAQELFTLVRDIPFVLGAEGKPETLIRDNCGGCTRKHLFLAPRLKRIGYQVDIGIAQFDWRKLPITDDILLLLKKPIQYHMFLYLSKNGINTIVDVTWDKGMSEKGFPLLEWSNGGGTEIAVSPIKISRVNLPILQVRSLVSQSLNNIKELIDGPQKTPFNDAFNNWLGRK